MASILSEAPNQSNNNVLYKTLKLLSHLTGAYVFGLGQSFNTWLEDRKPTHWKHMKILRHETCRHNVQLCESASSTCKSMSLQIVILRA